MSTLPLFEKNDPDALFCIKEGERISNQTFVGEVLSLAAVLPSSHYLINLCADRYHFLLSFVAAMRNGQTSLLPPSRAPREIDRLRAAYGDCAILDDTTLTQLRHQSANGPEISDAWGARTSLSFEADHNAAIPFTSGSTGHPQPHPKSWGLLYAGCKRGLTRFGLAAPARRSLIATVPCQHMYGLEHSIIYPLLSDLNVNAAKPFYPEDVRQALAVMPEGRVLITSPVHLRACVQSGLSWPSIDLVISATAPLEVELAQQAEEVFACQVKEVYGCTEIGAVASRRTAREEVWHSYDEYRLSNKAEAVCVEVPELGEPVVLNDDIEQIDERHFRLLGRSEDMLNIGGKRGSLADMNFKLRSIPGLQDGVFYLPPSRGVRRSRLVAFVVGDTPSDKRIIDELAGQLDAVYLPKRIFRVARLPYNETGKLSRAALEALYRQCKG